MLGARQTSEVGKGEKELEGKAKVNNHGWLWLPALQVDHSRMRAWPSGEQDYTSPTFPRDISTNLYDMKKGKILHKAVSTYTLE